MGKVQLKIAPSFITQPDSKSYDWSVTEKEIKEGSTIKDLLTELVSSYPDFRNLVYDPATGTLSKWVMIILNDMILHSPDVPGTVLNSNDSIAILPIYEGG